MRLLQTIGAALAGGVLGALVGLAFGALCVKLFNVPSREGESGYLMVAVGLIGAILGVFVGIGLSLRSGGLGAGRIILNGGGALLGLAALGGLVFLYFSMSHPHQLEIDGARVNLEFELRVPARRSLPPDPREALRVTLSTVKSQVDATLTTDRPRREGDYLVFPGVVNLPYREKRRLLVVVLRGSATEIFSLDLGAQPKPTKVLGEWHRSSFFDRDPGAAAGPKPVEKGSLPDGFEVRYRIALFGE